MRFAMAKKETACRPSQRRECRSHGDAFGARDRVGFSGPHWLATESHLRSSFESELLRKPAGTPICPSCAHLVLHHGDDGRRPTRGAQVVIENGSAVASNAICPPPVVHDDEASAPACDCFLRYFPGGAEESLAPVAVVKASERCGHLALGGLFGLGGAKVAFWLLFSARVHYRAHASRHARRGR